MARAYIAAPFTGKTSKKSDRPYGKIGDKEYIRFLESIEDILREFSFTVILPHKYVYRWGDSNFEPNVLIERALENLKMCDLLVAYPEKSRGANVLIGWATLLKKKIIILLHEGDDISIVFSGLNSLTETRIIMFKDLSDLKIKLNEQLKKMFIG